MSSVVLALLLGGCAEVTGSASALDASDASPPGDVAALEVEALPDAAPGDVGGPDIAPDDPAPLDDAGCWAGGVPVTVPGGAAHTAVSFAASRSRYAAVVASDAGHWLVVLDARARPAVEPRRVPDGVAVVSLDEGFGLVDADGLQPLDLSGAPAGARVAVRLAPHSVERLDDVLLALRPIEEDGGVRHALVHLPTSGRGPVTETGVTSPPGWAVIGKGRSRLLLRSRADGATRLGVASAAGTTAFAAGDELREVADSLWVPGSDSWALVGGNTVPGGMLYDYALRYWRVSAAQTLTPRALGQDHGYVTATMVRADGAFAAIVSAPDALTVVRGGDALGAERFTALPGLRWTRPLGAWSPEMNRYAVLHGPASSDPVGAVAVHCFGPS